MYEFLKEIASGNTWSFTYGRPDYQNLYKEVDTGQIGLFVDPITIDSKFSDSGNESLTYSGRFMMLISSDVDEDYETKYAEHIKPIIDDALQLMKDELACSNYQIQGFRMLEVINYFDYNLDGVIIKYTISHLD